MALHMRARLRQAVALQLKNQTTAAANVFPARVRPTTASQLPCLLVFTEDETAERYTGGTTVRRVDLVIRGRVATVGDPPQDTLDALALEIEQAIAGDESLGGLAFDLQLVRTHSGASAQSDRQAGDIDLTYAVEIHTANNDPTRPI
jgi:hypothetical protein